MSEVPPAGYDTVELARRMAVCFSVSELRELAAVLGIASKLTSVGELRRPHAKLYGSVSSTRGFLL